MGTVGEREGRAGARKGHPEPTLTGPPSCGGREMLTDRPRAVEEVRVSLWVALLSVSVTCKRKI